MPERADPGSEIVVEEKPCEDSVADVGVRSCVLVSSFEALKELFSNWTQLLTVVRHPCVDSDHPDPYPTLLLINRLTGVDVRAYRSVSGYGCLLQSCCQGPKEACDYKGGRPRCGICIASPDG
jgi:hypothetical protein